jgi:hypothetical protein
MNRPRRRRALCFCLATMPWQACDTGDAGPGGARARTVDETPPVVDGRVADAPDADLREPSEPPEPPRIEDIRAVVPGANLPPEVLLQRANNNLDLVDHDGRLYLAFRTAPNHFASASTRLYVVSTEDEISWRFEGEFFEGTDLREPRLLSLNGELFLYYAVLGTDRLAFEPQGMKRSVYEGPGRWSEPEWFYGEGFIPWRVKVLPDEPGVAYLVAYIGGENLYEVDGEAVSVHWLRTTDGRSFEPAAPDAPDAPVVLRGGTSETDFTRLADGTVIAVARNEAGDAEVGFGSKICRGEAASPGVWRCAADVRRFDSPLVFAHEGRVYLIGRRNVTPSGAFDLGRDDLPLAEQSVLYAADYWNKPKRCSLWAIDAEALTATFVLDLPSKGDTCFASAVPRGPDRYLVYNYSSPVDGPDVGWLTGQAGPTLLYRQMLVFPGVP